MFCYLSSESLSSLELYRPLSFCCLAFACILLGFCLLAFSLVAILHCCAFSFWVSFYLCYYLLCSAISLLLLFFLLSCDDLDYPHDFPTVSVPKMQLISPCADRSSVLRNRRSGRSSYSDLGITSLSNMSWKETREPVPDTGKDAIPLRI